MEHQFSVQAHSCDLFPDLDLCSSIVKDLELISLLSSVS